jgi:probable selenium-dependent hydroxylase accessory protein YqeC
MRLAEALDLRSGEMTALIGAGGKTTTMFRVAKELREQGYKVLVTTTTKIFKPTKPHVDRLFLVDNIDDFANASASIDPPVTVAAGYGVDEQGKLLGLPTAWLDRLNETGKYDAILVEADGAASRLLKLPSEHEPVIPSSCKLTVWLMAIKVLGKPFDAESVHRAERLTEVLGEARIPVVTEEIVLRLVKQPGGCLKGVPPASRKVALINQADDESQLEAARSLGKQLLGCGLERVVISSYTSEDPVKDVLTQ